MILRLISIGVKQLFGGARRGQPIVAAIGAALSIWGLFRRFSGSSKPVYTRELRDGETIRVSLRRGETAIEDAGQ